MLALMLTACGPSNTVMLTAPAELTPPNHSQPKVALVIFEDSRGKNVLGVRRDKSHFFADGDVRVWFSKTLADKLNEAGMNVVYVGSTAEAVSSQAKYILTGAIDTLWLKESSSTNMSAVIDAHYTIEHGNKTDRGSVHVENENNTIIFSTGAAANLFDDAMKSFCDKAIVKIQTVVK